MPTRPFPTCLRCFKLLVHSAPVGLMIMWFYAGSGLKTLNWGRYLWYLCINVLYVIHIMFVHEGASLAMSHKIERDSLGGCLDSGVDTIFADKMIVLVWYYILLPTLPASHSLLIKTTPSRYFYLIPISTSSSIRNNSARITFINNETGCNRLCSISYRESIKTFQTP